MPEIGLVSSGSRVYDGTVSTLKEAASGSRVYDGTVSSSLGFITD